MKTEKKKEIVKESLEEFVEQIQVTPYGELTEEEKVHKLYYQRVKPNRDLIITMLGEGYSEKDIYTLLGISRTTWYRHRGEIPEFDEMVTLGRIRILSEIENSIYKQALGEVHTKTTKTKEVFNPETGEFEPIEREVQVKQEKPSERMAEYILRRFSPHWRDSTDEEQKENSKMVESIANLIDTITGPMDNNLSTLEETTQESQGGKVKTEGNGSSQEEIIIDEKED